MKKKYLLGLFALSTILLVGCKDKQTDVDTDLAQAIQQERETLTKAEIYAFGDFYETETTNEVNVIFASSNVQILYDGLHYAGLAGTGYALNAIFNSDVAQESILPIGTYVADNDEELAPFTYNVENTYLSVINGGNTTKVLLEDAKFTVSQEGENYTIAFEAITTAGAKVKATYKGLLDVKNPAAFRESTKAAEIAFEAIDVTYAAKESNYADWAVDSVYSYYADLYTYYAEYYYQQGDSATGDELAEMAAEQAYYKEYYTPMNAHYFTITSENGDVLNLEIDLWSLDPEYTAVLPNGKYMAAPGESYMEDVADLWGSSWNVYGSYLTTANEEIYYLDEALVDVNIKEGNEVQNIQVKGTTINGTKINITFGVNK